jgi:short subunit fatty acids transporter
MHLLIKLTKFIYHTKNDYIILNLNKYNLLFLKITLLFYNSPFIMIKRK